MLPGRIGRLRAVGSIHHEFGCTTYILIALTFLRLGVWRIDVSRITHLGSKMGRSGPIGRPPSLQNRTLAGVFQWLLLHSTLEQVCSEFIPYHTGIFCLNH